MHIMTLKEWEIGKAEKEGYKGRDLRGKKEPAEGWIKYEGIGQVHDILIEKGLIPGEVLENGQAGEIRELAKWDWIYRTQFEGGRESCRYYLRCAGLDTVCDVYLNGTWLGLSESMYLPFEKDITAYMRQGEKNELKLYFHGHRKMLDYYEESMPEEYRGVVPATAMLLKSEDYGAFASDRTGYGYSPIGVFDEVTVTETEDVRWEAPEIDVYLNENFGEYGEAEVRVRLKGEAYREGRAGARIRLRDSRGETAGEAKIEKSCGEGRVELEAKLKLKEPELWWPKNYGAHPLYRAEVVYEWNGEERDRAEKPFGVRSIRKTGNMRFTCNGVPIRFWGGNIAPIYGPSNVFNGKVAFDLLEKIDQAGMNAVRIWGPSKPYPDSFYDVFDRQGILVWQDFPTGGSPLPWDEHYTALLEEEVRHMVKRLKHHPSIYQWCGGNENIYMNEFYEDNRDKGFGILLHNFKKVCEETDPTRVYHVSCPYEGKYTNDPLYGDSHGSRAYRRYIPGEAYGAFYSENIRCYPPQYKSMKRWLGDEIWEEGYVDEKPFGRIKPMPDSWAKRLGNNGEEKLGPIEDYYAGRTPEELVYKFTAAAGQDLYGMYARSRRGKPAYKSEEENICQGFTLWKINDPWPNFYCALVDYYGECSLPYYAVKRAIKPVWIDLEVSDHIYLWGVNDTNEDFRGSIEITAYRMDEKKVIRHRTLPAALLKGSSRIVTDLDSFGPMHWFTVLNARLYDEEGNTVVSSYAYLRKENMLPFPDAHLTVEISGDELTVRTDDFARCVELSGGEDGMEFGWVFEDNYFDLLPNEEKKVRILKTGKSRLIRAKPHYASEYVYLKTGGGEDAE